MTGAASSFETQLSRLADLMPRSQAAFVGAATHHFRRVIGQEFSVADAATIAYAYGRAFTELSLEPGRLASLQRQVTAELSRWASGASQNHGGDGSGADRRFKHPDWQHDAAQRAIKDWYLAASRIAIAFADLGQTDPKARQRVSFYTRQFVNALAPTNFLPTNPEARHRAIETGGASLMSGLEHLVRDLERGEGRLDIRMTDENAFEVGRNLAITPGSVVFRNDLMELIQYTPTTETVHQTPLLLVPAWINKFYIFDLRPENSFVRWLVGEGHTVFVISWRNPTRELAGKSFEDYLREGVLKALDAVRDITGEPKANLLGFCIGGILVTSALAWLAAKGDDRIASATTLATMVDFENVGEIAVFIDEERLAALETHMRDKGFLEAHHLQDMFSMLRENDLVWTFAVNNYLMGREPPAFDLLFWNADATRLPAAMLLYYLRKVYLENGLRKPGGMVLEGVAIDVSRIRTPCFVLATKEDHIAPWKSVYPATQLFGGEVAFVLGGSGHIAGVINPPGKSKYGFRASDNNPVDAERWLSGSQEHQGSWWPYWLAWVKRHAGELAPARIPKKSMLGDAPGSYVLRHET